ncbi:MAG: HAD-IA family hydrolase [Egibacteraceae bacterium]
MVFDVDGTLVDSERHGHRPAFNDAFAEAALPYRWSEDAYADLVTTPGGRRRIREFLVGQGHPAEEAAALAVELHQRKTEIFMDLATAGRIPPRPGVARLLDELADAGVPLGVATTGSRVWVEPLLDHLFGLARFETVVAGDDVSALKPDPSVYREVLRRLGAAVGSVVVVEDSHAGVTAAVGAGLPCLAVVNDYTTGQDCGGAALVVDGFGGPGRARVLDGPDDLLDEGMVTVSTLGRLTQT